MNRRGFLYSCTAGLVCAGLFGASYSPPHASLKDAVSNQSLRQKYIEWLAHRAIGSRRGCRFIYEGDSLALAKTERTLRLAMLDDPRSIEYIRNAALRDDLVGLMLEEGRYSYGFKTKSELRRFLASDEGLAAYIKDMKEEEKNSPPEPDNYVNGSTISNIFDIGNLQPQVAYITGRVFEPDSMFIGDDPDTWKEVPIEPSELAIKSVLAHENRHMLDAHFGVSLSPKIRIYASNILQIRPDIFSFVLESRGWITGMTVAREGNPPRDVCSEYVEVCNELEAKEKEYLDLAKADITSFERSIHEHQMPIFSRAAAESREALTFAKRKYGVL